MTIYTGKIVVNSLNGKIELVVNGVPFCIYLISLLESLNLSLALALANLYWWLCSLPLELHM